MAKTLVIVESPTKAKTIKKFLGKNYDVKSSMGHVRDLPKSQIGVDVENDFEPKYITIRGKGEVLKELKAAAKKADKILLAPDPDREGEAIAWHLAHYLIEDKDLKKSRIEFNEITKDAIKKAVKSARAIDYDKVDAQQGRRILDRLVGYNLSPLLWKKIKKGLSAGRVQSVTLWLICEREKEIEAFEIEEYWTIEALLKGSHGSLKAKVVHENKKILEIANEEEAQRITDILQQESYEVRDVKSKEKKRQALPPFITSTLQQEANKKLGYTAKKTMQLAQQLYEGINIGKGGTIGLITYIRTDAYRVAEHAQEEAKTYLQENYGQEYLPLKPNSFKSKGKIQDAHEAIRPTGVLRTPAILKEFLKPQQFRLYKLIWERFLASQMAPALTELTTIDIQAGSFDLKASGTQINFPGFLKVYSPDEKADKKTLPQVKVEEKLNLDEIIPKQHFTQPPARYSEAALVKTLEEKGIGRPSTYAPIIDTLNSRGYVLREEKKLVPTELGIMTVSLLKEYFPKIIDEKFSAQMEEDLDKVADGEIGWRQVVGEFFEPFSKDLKHAEEEIGEIEIEDEVSDVVCDKCGRMMVYKLGRYGKFLACPGFPECRNTKPIIVSTGIKCPVCGKGDVVLRKGKKGRAFYGCSLYPECEFVSWNKPLDEKCPDCGSYLVDNGKHKECSNSECGKKIIKSGEDG